MGFGVRPCAIWRGRRGELMGLGFGRPWRFQGRAVGWSSGRERRQATGKEGVDDPRFTAALFSVSRKRELLRAARSCKPKCCLSLVTHCGFASGV